MLRLEKPRRIESEAHLFRDELREHERRACGITQLGVRVRKIESHELRLRRLNGKALIETRRGGAEVLCFDAICAGRGARDHRDFVEAQCVC